MGIQNPVLVFTAGALKGQAVPLEGNQLSLGRSRANDITLIDDALSRRHLVIRRVGADLVAEDLKSAHGTFLNGKRLRGILSMSQGDEVQLGDQKFTLMSQEDVAEMPDIQVVDLKAAGPAELSVADIEEAEQGAEADAVTRYHGSDEEAEDLDATRYHEVAGFRAEEDEDAKTRVLEDSATRMLDFQEMSGLKPGKQAEGLSKKALAGIVLVALLLVGGGVAAMMLLGRPEETAVELQRYQDAQYRFGIRYPSTWLKTSTDPDAVIAFEDRPQGELLAYLKVYVDASLAHEVTGLTVGFNNYAEEVLAKRYEGFRLRGSKTLALNRLRVIQYGFSSKDAVGFGLFTFSGPNRFDVQVATVPSAYAELGKEVLGYLRYFFLGDPQQVIDFPVADDQIRRKALADSPGLAAEALEDLDLARDRMKRLNTRADNLYRAIAQYRLALTKASALSDRPPFYDAAARELGEATRQLDNKLEEQWFKVRQAEKTGNWTTVEWELTKILALIPDRDDPVYRRAEKKLKNYGYEI